MSKVKVGAGFAVVGSTYRELTMDAETIKGMSVQQIADAMESLVDSPSLCHECSGECEDAMLDGMTSISIDGKEYNWDDGAGEWKLYVRRSGR